jgi:dihydroflavonol-4-reductase
MRALVTGATGFIGYHVARHLVEKGSSVRALVRANSDVSHLRALDVEMVLGDIRDEGCLKRACIGCSQVYHVAADYRLWVPDVETMYEINVQGTQNILRAASGGSVEKIVYTSSAGVLPFCTQGESVSENSRAAIGDMIGHYKKSKFLAEQAVYPFVDAGLPVVIVNPSTPIGAYDSKPTPTGRIVVDFLNGKIPAYLDTGLNFVDVEDVAAGHVLAAQRGRIGHRYILGNRNMKLREFFSCVAAQTGHEPPAIRLPYLPVLLAAYANEAFSRATGTQPRIPLTGVKLAKNYMYYDCSKAVQELKLPQSPVEQAIKKAIQWFQENGYVPARQKCAA